MSFALVFRHVYYIFLQSIGILIIILFKSLKGVFLFIMVIVSIQNSLYIAT